MTREHDRIQENTNEYIVRDCPAIISLYERPQCALPSNYYCKDCTDCVIKQVIEIAKDIIEKDCYENSDVKAEKILRLFDIEEVKE